MDKYFGNKILASEWEDKLFNRISLNLFKNQERWIDMYGEHGYYSKPRIREEFLDEFEEQFDEAIAGLYITVAENLIDKYIKDDIDLDKYMANWYNELRGLKPGDDGYVEGVAYEGDTWI